MDDFCVIMIGETDFYSPQNIKLLVEIIRSKLHNITNTNVIVAAPTYILGKMIYNYRIESFNNELFIKCLDLTNVHVFDSNKELTMDMFSEYSGKINKNGIKCIFHYITELVKIIQENYKDTIDMHAKDVHNNTETSLNDKNEQFFLLQ